MVLIVCVRLRSWWRPATHFPAALSVLLPVVGEKPPLQPHRRSRHATNLTLPVKRRPPFPSLGWVDATTEYFPWKTGICQPEIPACDIFSNSLHVKYIYQMHERAFCSNRIFKDPGDYFNNLTRTVAQTGFGCLRCRDLEADPRSFGQLERRETPPREEKRPDSSERSGCNVNWSNQSVICCSFQLWFDWVLFMDSALACPLFRSILWFTRPKG